MAAATKDRGRDDRRIYAKQYWDIADIALNQGDMNKAIKFYETAFGYVSIEENERYLSQLKIIASGLKRQNHAALPSFEKLIEKISQSQAQIARWQAPPVMLQAHTAYKEKDYKKAAAIYAIFDWGKFDKDRTFKYQRENYDALMKTKQYLQVKQFAEKLISLTLKGGTEENNYLHYRYLADALSALGEIPSEQVVANYEKSIELASKAIEKCALEISALTKSQPVPFEKIRALNVVKKDLQDSIVDCFNGLTQIYLDKGQLGKANECIVQAAKYSGEVQLVADMKNKPAVSVSPELAYVAPPLVVSSPDTPNISDYIDNHLLDPWLSEEQNDNDQEVLPTKDEKTSSSKTATVAERLVKSMMSVLQPSAPPQRNIQQTAQSQVFSSADADPTDGLTCDHF